MVIVLFMGTLGFCTFTADSDGDFHMGAVLQL